MKIQTLLLTFLMSLTFCKAQYTVPYVPETNQPNCVVGAFCMYAKETMNTNLDPWFLQSNTPSLNHKGVETLEILPAWNKMFPTNKIVDIWNVDTDVYLNQPYMWVGFWETNVESTHACLIYFHSNEVVYKNFVYWPITHTNYMTTNSWLDFFQHTVALYSIHLNTLNTNE